jgi:hypothetical protein
MVPFCEPVPKIARVPIYDLSLKMRALSELLCSAFTPVMIGMSLNKPQWLAHWHLKAMTLKPP